MRTTVTLDPDVAAQLRRLAAERGMTFKEAINSLLRVALGSAAAEPVPFETPARTMGLRVDVTHALSLAASLEDAEVARKLELRK